MKMTDELRSTYNKIAQDYHRDHAVDSWDDDYTGYFIDLLPRGAVVLDLGCGPGTDTKKLVAAGLVVHGFDLSDEFLRIAQEKNPGVDFIQGDMRTLPYPTNIFDGVYAKASLLHIPKADMLQALREIFRVVTPGGVVHVAIKAGDGEREVAEDDYGYAYQRFFSYWSAADFCTIIRKGGFEIMRYEEVTLGQTAWLKFLLQK